LYASGGDIYEKKMQDARIHVSAAGNGARCANQVLPNGRFTINSRIINLIVNHSAF